MMTLLPPLHVALDMQFSVKERLKNSDQSDFKSVHLNVFQVDRFGISTMAALEQYSNLIGDYSHNYVVIFLMIMRKEL